MTFKKKKKRAKVKGKTRTKTLPNNFITVFNKKLLIRANKETREFAKGIAAEAKSIIKEQRYNWPPLSDNYLNYKLNKGLDDRIYIATGEYLIKGIGYFEKGGFIFVGPKPGIHKPSKLPYEYLGRILEYGTDTIPARQLWRPLLSSTLRKSQKFKRTFQEATKKSYNQQVKRSTKTTTRRV